MKSSEPPLADSQSDLWSDSELFATRVQQSLEQAVQEAIEDHHRAGNPVAVWRDGQVVLWYPDGSYQPVPSETSADDPRG